MSKGIEFDPVAGRITIVNGSRTVATTDGTLVCVLPEVLEVDDAELIFPDFQKDNLYAHSWGSDYATATGDYYDGESCAVYITALPEEYSDKTVLADAPDGADFFIGRVRLHRDTSPLSTWMGQSIGVLPIEDEWLPWSGSCLMEADINMARAMHIYIDDDSGSATYRKLVMEAEQSVGPPIGGFSTGFSSGTASLDWSGGSLRNGGNTATGSRNGFPILLRAGSKSRGWAGPHGMPFSQPNQYAYNGASPCSRSDTTSYTSIYSIDVRGRFGRRS